MIQPDEIKKQYLDAFQIFENSLNGEKEKPFHLIRKEAIESFSKLNFPAAKDEEWRFTNISPILKNEFVLSSWKKSLTNDDISKFLIEGLEANLLTFVNGNYSAELSSFYDLPEGAIICNIAEAAEKHYELLESYFAKYAKNQGSIFTSLNAAFTNNGAFVYIPDGKIIDKPVMILHLVSAGEDKLLIQPRNLFIAGNNSQVKIIENYASANGGVYFTNAVTEIICGENAVVEHIKLQNESHDAFHIATIEIDLEKQSNFSSYNVSLGSAITRNNINAKFNAEWSECTLNGLLLTDGTQLIDNHTMIDHAVPNCVSHELYKGVLNGKSKAVFNGKVMVRKDAQKTNAFQQNKTILLSDEALIDTKPQLEIFADDVKCSHGATIGRLDEDSLFYLQARGIGLEQAKTILIYAFASDVVHSIKIDPLKDHLEKLLAERLMK
jgi:Fe-S cluster assembly protein SufD